MNLIVLSIPIFVLLIGLELLIARLKQTRLYRLNDSVANINCGLLSLISGAFIKTALVAIYIGLYENFRLIEAIPETWWMYVLLFVGVDFCYYWFHRLAHEVSAFWGTHIVHHQSEEYNLSVALRQSSLQAFISTFFYLPLALIGFHPVAFITVNALQTLYQFWIHTKTIDRLPAAFEYVFNTPSHHRVHHGRNPKYIDKNHGGALIVFDRLFGTFQEEEETVVYGVTKSTNSWNPVWVNVDYYRDLWADMQQMQSWGERLKLLFAPPGWLPQRLGGPRFAPSVENQQPVRFDPVVPVELNYYVLVTFVLTLLGGTYFLFAVASLSLGASLVWACLIAWAMAASAWLLEYRKLGFYAESLRLLTTPIALWYLLPLSWATWPMLFALIVFHVSLLIGLWQFSPRESIKPIWSATDSPRNA